MYKDWTLKDSFFMTGGGEYGFTIIENTKTGEVLEGGAFDDMFTLLLDKYDPDEEWTEEQVNELGYWVEEHNEAYWEVPANVELYKKREKDFWS